LDSALNFIFILFNQIVFKLRVPKAPLGRKILLIPQRFHRVPCCSPPAQPADC
jgi:hypothetical protein